MWRECYTHAFANRRQRLNLSKDDIGVLLFDGFTGNTSAADGLDKDRSDWLREDNIRTCCLEAHASAEMQPCDCAHAYFRTLCDAYENYCCGFLDDPTARTTLADRT